MVAICMLYVQRGMVYCRESSRSTTTAPPKNYRLLRLLCLQYNVVVGMTGVRYMKTFIILTNCTKGTVQLQSLLRCPEAPLPLSSSGVFDHDRHIQRSSLFIRPFFLRTTTHTCFPQPPSFKVCTSSFHSSHSAHYCTICIPHVQLKRLVSMSSSPCGTRFFSFTPTYSIPGFPHSLNIRAS